jgi:hypothetical protein
MSIYKLPDPRPAKVAAKNAAYALKLLNQMRDELMRLGLWTNDQGSNQCDERTSFILDKQIYIEDALALLSKPGHVLPIPVRFSDEGLKVLFHLVDDRESMKPFLELVDSLYELCSTDQLTLQRQAEKKLYDEKCLRSQASKQRQIENIKRKS